MGGRLVPDDDDDVTDYVFTKYRSTEFNHFPISHFPNLILIFLKTKPTKTISQNKEIFITGLSQGRLGKNPWTRTRSCIRPGTNSEIMDHDQPRDCNLSELDIEWPMKHIDRKLHHVLEIKIT